MTVKRYAHEHIMYFSLAMANNNVVFLNINCEKKRHFILKYRMKHS